MAKASASLPPAASKRVTGGQRGLQRSAEGRGKDADDGEGERELAAGGDDRGHYL